MADFSVHFTFRISLNIEILKFRHFNFNLFSLCPRCSRRLDNDKCDVGSIERPFSDRSSPLPIPSYHVEILTTGRRTNRTSIGKIKFFKHIYFLNLNFNKKNLIFSCSRIFHHVRLFCKIKFKWKVKCSFWVNNEIVQGFPQMMRLHRRLNGIYTVCFFNLWFPLQL